MEWYALKELPPGVSRRTARRLARAWERDGRRDLVRRGARRRILLSQDAVGELQRRRRGPGRPPRCAPTDDELVTVWDASGGSITAVARWFGVSFRYARRRLIEAGAML